MFSLGPRLVFALLCVASLWALHVSAGSTDYGSFAGRCADPAVIRCYGFERKEMAGEGGPIYWGHARKPAGVFANGLRPSDSLSGRAKLASDQFSSGETSLKFFMPSNTGGGHAGQFYSNFSDDLSVQFGEGDEFYIQWRQRFSEAFVDNVYKPFNSWKQVIIGEGSRPDFHTKSCTQLELVVYNKSGAPDMYHSCRGKDGRSEGLNRDVAVKYVANEWMTFQVRVKIGTWYKNDKNYSQDSLIELWVAREGESSELVLKKEYDLANTGTDAQYGKVWLLPYLTGKSKEQQHPDAYTWYDDLIISRARIADPGF